MRVAKKGVMLSMLVLGLSGATYAMGAGGGGEGGAGSAGQGGTGMGTPNASGATDTMSGASGSNTMGHSGSKSKKQMQKKGAMDSPASSSEMKKPTRREFWQYAHHGAFAVFAANAIQIAVAIIRARLVVKESNAPIPPKQAIVA